ncbi:MAG: helix-turn-helix transcriptional regulator [Clostridia bacterium]|nr:helix-turn-helix transcriptional regulator [Deltaproteobacteria bacterium]
MKTRGIRYTLAHNLRRAIEKQGLGVNKLADFAGVSRSQLYDVLGSKKGASVDWIDKIAEVLKMEPWQLLRSDGTENSGSKSSASRPSKAPAKKKKAKKR